MTGWGRCSKVWMRCHVMSVVCMWKGGLCVAVGDEAVVEQRCAQTTTLVYIIAPMAVRGALEWLLPVLLSHCLPDVCLMCTLQVPATDTAPWTAVSPPPPEETPCSSAPSAILADPDWFASRC
jgi:hypothetical protein